MIPVTVVTVTNHRIDQHALAVIETANRLPFKVRQLVCSPREPARMYYRGDWCQTDDWGKGWFAAYNVFMQRGLCRVVSTPYCITVQEDGYATHADQWTNEFFDYDFVGAPWPLWLTLASRHSPNPFRRVGNGGFSLRSRAWLEAGWHEPPMVLAEDVSACRTNIKTRLLAGLTVAPLSLAKRWAIEYPVWRQRYEKCFGFHGFLNNKPLAMNSLWQQLKYFLSKCGRR